ncbi:heterokaryon incompatibility protein-domain-containing protein, partial [Leptodontidium sp. 2 PMI_412]
WIDFCRLNHSGDCVPTALIGISSFRVINCTTQSVINAPQNCQFVALSYVWGRSDLSNQDRKSGAPSLHAAPKVIADSIEVTRLLGFQYLWVDRYCINQSDTYEKHDQICRMDAIYASAQLTIIAAGDDPDMGLPGVNGTLRNPQPIYQVRDYTLVSSLTAASASLHQTAWASRGWTYQEGLLSKRRLLFLSDQVYFECNGMHCTE